MFNKNEFLKDLQNFVKRAFDKDLISLVIFGSFAKGLYTASSDIDILIILNKKPEYSDYEKFFSKVEDKLNKKYGLIKLSPILRDKKTISEKTAFLWDDKFIVLFDKGKFFERIKDKIKELKSKGKIIYKRFPIPHYIFNFND